MMEATLEAAADHEGALQPGSIGKKPNIWKTGVLSCMTSVLSLFGKRDLIDEFFESFFIKPERIIEAKCIGQGAQGKVHLASLKYPNYGARPVAIKYVQKIDDMTIRHLRQINHPNIVQTLGVCISPPKYFIVMEYCANGSLFDNMRAGIQFTPQQMITWAREIACGMRHLHSKNIVHRDLKSPNVLLNGNFVVKVSDFGTCRTIDGKSAVMTFVGTVNWMAPEVIRAESYTGKVDVWSFAVVLWELVTLQIPYDKMEQHAIMWGVGTDAVSLPIPTGLPNSIHVLLVQCWNRHHQLRPTFAKIIESLDMIAEELMLYDYNTFVEKQNVWAREARDSLEKAYLRSEEQNRNKVPAYTKLDLYSRRDLKEKKSALARRMNATNDLFFEICAVRLALECREREVAQKEKLVEACRCGLRRKFKIQHQLSSSSDGAALAASYRAHLAKKTDPQLLVKIINESIITSTVEEPCICNDNIARSKIRLDSLESKKDTVVEMNGNVDIKHGDFKTLSTGQQEQDIPAAVDV